MNHAEINRRLRDSDPQVHYVIMYLYEQVVEMQKQLDESACALLSIAQIAERVVQLNAHTQDVLENIRKRGSTPGIDVYSESVLDEPKDR
jgi:hypothetical protein